MYSNSCQAQITTGMKPAPSGISPPTEHPSKCSTLLLHPHKAVSQPGKVIAAEGIAKHNLLRPELVHQYFPLPLIPTLCSDRQTGPALLLAAQAQLLPTAAAEMPQRALP